VKKCFHEKTQLAIALLLFLAVGLTHATVTKSGEAWSPLILTDPAVRARHYLPDFSFIGYRWGKVSVLLAMNQSMSTSGKNCAPIHRMTKCSAALPSHNRCLGCGERDLLAAQFPEVET
jgi:hypothetical protein